MTGGESRHDSIGAEDRTMMVNAPAELGPYRLTHVLGKGGMGEVWLAVDTKLERDVAIKLMRRELLSKDEAVKRFQREARAVARLNHPAIVQVYSFGDEEGVIYFAMEMVDGETVSQRLKHNGPFSVEDAVNVMLQTIEGLSYAHARGIIHRDIKPSNLMLTREFHVKITDFGLAKMVETDTQMTQAGTSLGSPSYMSPEQARGEEADHRSDIYALGITLYQMLTGELPFTAATPLAVLLQQIQEPLPEPEPLQQLQNGEVMAVIRKMTSKNADDRYQTYGGLSAAINSLAPSVQLRPSGFTPTASYPTPARGTIVLPKPSESVPADQAAPAADGTPSSAVFSEADSAHPRAQVRTAKSKGPLYAVLAAAAVGIGAVAFWMTTGTDRGSRPQAAGSGSPTPAATVKEETPAAAATPALPTAAPAAVPTPAQTPSHTPPPSTTPQASPPAATVAATAAPTPAAVQTLVRVGGPTAVVNAPVTVYSQAGQAAGTLPAGATVPYLRAVQGFYVISHQGSEYLLRIEDGQQLMPGQAAATPAAAASLELVIGTGQGGPDEMIDVWSSEEGKRKTDSLRAGTVVRMVDQTAAGYTILAPSGRTGFVFKGTAYPRR